MEEENIDIEIENLLDEKKKKIKSGKKGKRVELEVVKILNNRFSKILSKNPSWGRFSRSIGSGNRWGQNVYLSKSAMESFSGDLVCPTNFNFIIESKGGYGDIDLCSAFDGGQSDLDSFLSQALEDSKRTSRKPMVLWKKDRKPRLSVIKKEDIDNKLYKNFEYYMYYREWIIFYFDDLLKLEDEFFFQNT